MWSPAYRHVYKRIQPGPCLELGDSYLKWYDIRPPEAPIPGVDQAERP